MSQQAQNGSVAKILTKNKQKTLQTIRADFYETTKTIMNDYYKQLVETKMSMKEQLKKQETNLLEDAFSFLKAAYLSPFTAFYDLLGGGLSGIGDAFFGILDYGAKVIEDIKPIFDDSDGRGAGEDIAFLFSNVVGDIAKGLGSTFFNTQASVNTVVDRLFIPGSDKEYFTAAAKDYKELEDWVNVNLIGKTVEAGRMLDGKTGILNYEGTFGTKRLSEPDFVRDYINERYEGEDYVRFINGTIEANNWYQKNIAEPQTNRLDELYPKEYKQYVEPAFNSIGRLLPSIALSYFASGSDTEGVGEVLGALAKTYFVSNTYGSGMREAVNSGASLNDAHLYAMSNTALELGTEMIGGFVPGKLSPASMKSVLKNILTETGEEFLAEVGGSGYEYLLDPERKMDNISFEELAGRTMYAALVGGLSGGIFGGIGKLRAQNMIETSAFEIQQELTKNLDKKNIDPKNLADNVKKLLEKLNDPKTPTWRKEQILQNPILKGLVTKTSGQLEMDSYILTKTGEKFASGDLTSRQGNVEINKDDFAVGNNEIVFDYLEEIAVGEFVTDSDGNVTRNKKNVKVKILTNEQVKKLSKQKQKDIQWFKDKGIRVAFVNGGRGSFSAYTDMNTGIVYINVQANNNAQGFKNAFSHELNDKMDVMFQKGLLTRKQFNAFKDFRNAIESGKFQKLLMQTGWTEKQQRYLAQFLTEEQISQINKNEKKLSEVLTEQQLNLLNREAVSHIIETVFDNEAQLKRAYAENPTILQRLASIFTNKEKFNTQFDVSNSPELAKMINNMQRNFQKLLKEGKSFAYAPQTIAEGLMLVTDTDPESMFSFDINMAGTVKADRFEDIERALQNPEDIRKIIGLDENYIINRTIMNAYHQKNNKADLHLENLTNQQREKFSIMHQGVTILEEGSPLKQKYDSEFGGDFFLKIGDKLYDRKKFYIPKGIDAKNITISFEHGYFFEVRFNYIGDATDMANLVSVENNGSFYGYEVGPDVIAPDGKLIRNPHELEVSFNPSFVDDMIKKDGKIISSSFAVSPAFIHMTGTSLFSRLFQDNGHAFTITGAYNPTILSKPGTFLMDADGFTPIRIFYDNKFQDGEQKYKDLGVNPDNELLIKQDVGTAIHIEAETRSVTSESAIDTMRKSIELMLKNVQSELERSPNAPQKSVASPVLRKERFITRPFLTVDSKNLILNLGQVLGKLSTISTNLYTNTTAESKISPEDVKRKINRELPTYKEIVDSSKQAAESLLRIFNNNISGEQIDLYTIGQALGIALNQKVLQENIKNAPEISREYTENKTDYDNVAKLHKMFQYRTNYMIVEGKLSDGDVATDLSVININHIGGNKNSAYYQKIKSFFESKGVVVTETNNKNSLETIYNSDPYYGTGIEGPIMKNGNYDTTNPFFVESTNPIQFYRTHNEDVTQSPSLEVSREALKNNGVFSLDSKNKKKKTKKKPKLYDNQDEFVESRENKIIESETEDSRELKELLKRIKARQQQKARELQLSPSTEFKFLRERLEALKDNLNLRTRQINERSGNPILKDLVKELESKKQKIEKEIQKVEAELQEKFNNTQPQEKKPPKYSFKGPTISEETMAEIRKNKLEAQTETQPEAQTEAQTEVQETKTTEQRKEEIVREVMDLIGTWSEEQTRNFLETKSVEQGMEVPLQDSKLDALANEYASLLQQDVQPEAQTEAQTEVQETQTEAQPEVQPETQPEVQPETQPEVQPEGQEQATRILEQLEKARQISERQTKATHKKFQKAFKNWLNGLDEIKNQPEEDFKFINKLYETHKSVISKDIRKGLYINHLSESMLIALTGELTRIKKAIKETTTRGNLELTRPEIDTVLERVFEAIFGAMAHMDDIVSKTYITDSNPTGRIYNRFTHKFLRKFMEADLSDSNVLNDLLTDDRGVFLHRLIDAILNINETNGLAELDGAVTEFIEKTDIDKVNVLSLNEDGTLRTTEIVIQEWRRNTRQIQKTAKQLKYKLTPALKYAELLDPTTFLGLQSLFLKNGWGNVLLKKIQEGVEKQIDVDRIYEEILNDQAYLNNNLKKLEQFEQEKNAVEIKNLENAKLTMSQIITLRNLLIREIIRNRAIDNGVILGEKSSHFDNGKIVDIIAMKKDANARVDQQQSPKIVDQIELLNELNTIVQNDSVAVELNDKVMTFFSKVFPLINERYSETNGQPLQNLGQELIEAIANDESLAEKILENMPDNININMLDKIYIPIYIGESGYFNQGDNKVDVGKVLKLGINDGFTQAIGDTDAIARIDSILNVLFKYKKETRNYYGLHSIMQSWNDITNAPLKPTPMERDIDSETQTVNMKRFISREAIQYVEKLLLDVAGYKQGESLEALAFLRKQFYRAVLAGNAKVIMTQLVTMYNLAVLYGDNFPVFFGKMYKNLVMQLSPKNRQELEQLKQRNNIYYNRTFAPTFDLGEAQQPGSRGLQKVIDVLMSGISLTDTAVNNALFLTLIESVNKETGQLYTREEADAILKKGILRSQSSALDFAKAPILRTESDILKTFLKFMGEPLKLQSQIFFATKQLELIRKLNARNKATGKTNEQTIKEELLEREAQTLQNLQEEQRVLDTLEQKEESEEFATLENQEQQKIRDDITRQKNKVQKAKAIAEDTSEYARGTIDSLSEIIASRPIAQEKLIRSISALMGTMIYMAGLNTLWYTILRDLGRLDDREEEEELANYLLRKFGENMFQESLQLFPFVRDIYGLLASGFSAAEIDEIAMVEDTIKLSYSFIEDITTKSPEELLEKLPEYGRRIGVYGLRVFGIPGKNIENLYTLYTMAFNKQDEYYRYRFTTGQRVSANKELRQAVLDGDDAKVEAIMKSKIASRNIVVSDATLDEITRISRLGVNVNITGINDSYTIDGVEYTLDEKQKIEFARIYNQADLVVQRVILSPKYKRLSEKKKASLIQSVYNYYLRLAKQKVLDVELVPDNRMFRTLSQAFRYFDNVVAERLLNEQRKEQRENRRKRR